MQVEGIEKENRFQSDDRLSYVFNYFSLVFGEDIRYRILNLLASREGANLREVSRCVGMSHTNCSKYLSTLVKKGVVDVYSVGVGMKVYRLSIKYDDLRKFLGNNNHKNFGNSYNHQSLR